MFFVKYSRNLAALMAPATGLPLYFSHLRYRFLYLVYRHPKAVIAIGAPLLNLLHLVVFRKASLLVNKAPHSYNPTTTGKCSDIDNIFWFVIFYHIGNTISEDQTAFSISINNFN
jgi:hypothetical protein